MAQEGLIGGLIRNWTRWTDKDVKDSTDAEVLRPTTHWHGATMADTAWSSKDMKLGTQSVNANGPTAFASGMPTVLPTHPHSSFAKLVVKSEIGQIVQQWLVLQNKCTLGSAASCALRCELPGIASYHALLVMGSRQVFIRALAPKLARNGVMVNELLLTEDQCTFEIAGHQFELIRNFKAAEPASADKSSMSKLKFTLARPLEIGQVRHPALIATQVPAQAIEQPRPRTVATSDLQPQWITSLIQSAMLPLERQLQDIIEPLAAVQSELDRRIQRERKRRKRPTKCPESSVTESSETALTTQIDVHPQFAQIPEPVIVPIISPEVQAQLAKQSDTLDSLNASMAEVKSHVGDLQRIVSENLASTNELRTAPQPDNGETLQHLTSVADQMQGLTTQLDEVKSHLGSLQRVVSENLASTNELRTAPQPDNGETLQHLTSVADQMQGLTTQLDEVKSHLGSLQRVVSENLASTNELRTAPQPDNGETLHRLTEVANQLNLLLQDMSARQISTEDTNQVWRQQLQTQIGELRDSVSAPESSILRANEIRLIQPNEIAAEIAPRFSQQFDSPHAIAMDGFDQRSIEPEIIELEAKSSDCAVQVGNEEVAEETPVPASTGTASSDAIVNLFNHYAWNSESSEDPAFAPAIESAPAPSTAASVIGWEVEESPITPPAIDFGATSVNFIEETIEETLEETSLAEESAADNLPSWWTDDDRTQFNDDARAADIPEPVATPDEAASFQTSSVWEVQIDVEPAPFELDARVNSDSAPLPNSLIANFSTQDPAIDEESLGEVSLDSDESQELSSLLERFDFASEPISDDLVNPGGDHKSISEPLNEAIAADIPTQDFASFVLQAEQDEIEMIDHSEAEHVRAERLVAPDPVAVQPDMDALSEPKGDEEEESVEDYMKRLMARMRGGSLEEEPKLSSPPPVALAPATSAPLVDSTSPSKITLPAPVTERVPSSTTSPFNPEEYVPKALAPEKNRNMAAMRELANTSARSAIQVSARRRYGTAIALKLAIALIGLGVGVTLVMINGFNVNIGLIAAIASFLVALIWGFDAFTTLKPLLRTAGETIESAKPTEPEGVA